MAWLAIKMLVGDPVKYLGILFGVTFATLLMSQQIAIFVSLLKRTASQILDIHDADIWVMDKVTRFIDEAPALPDQDLYRVRSVPGVVSAVRLVYSQLGARLLHGGYRTVILMGLDDPSLSGAPTRFIAGSLQRLREPDAVVVDKAGYTYLFPNEPLELDRVFEMNERRARIVGICEASQPFTTLPVLFSRYSQATQYLPPNRNLMNYILVRGTPGTDQQVLCDAIESMAQTGPRPLAALTREQFAMKTVNYYMESTGIPVNFGITITLGFIVGLAITGQTFYLFVTENIRQFGALKAMGVDNTRLVGMILLQGFVAGSTGYGLGIGLAACFFEGTAHVPALEGFGMFPGLLVGIALTVMAIVTLASLLSIRKVLVLEPAMVFR